MEVDDKLARNIEKTAMAIREELMDYFKGSCVERMVTHNTIVLAPVDQPRGYQYQRQLAQAQAKARLYLGDIPLLTVYKQPDTVVFNRAVLERSPQLKELYKLLVDFFEKYLLGVEVKHTRGRIVYAQ